MKQSDFKAFGVSETLNKVLKKTSTMEIIFGGVFIAISAVCFAFIICLLGYNSWGQPFFEFFGYNGFESRIDTLKLFSAVIICGICGLGAGAVALVWGMNTKKSTTNPVSFLKAKNWLRFGGGFYVVVAIVLASCFFLSFAFWPLILFFAVMFLLCVLLATTKFVETLFFPDKNEILDVNELSSAQKKKILSQSSRTSFDEPSYETKSKTPKKASQKSKNLTKAKKSQK